MSERLDLTVQWGGESFDVEVWRDAETVDVSTLVVHVDMLEGRRISEDWPLGRCPLALQSAIRTAVDRLHFRRRYDPHGQG